jgi:hypothetical protein
MFPGFRLGVSSLDWPSHPQQCGGHLCIAVHKLRGGVVMSDESDWDFAGADDAKAEIRAAVRNLLKGAAGSDRAVISRGRSLRS